MDTENLYITLKLSNYILYFLKFFFIMLFLVICFVKAFSKDYREQISFSNFIKDIVYSVIFMIVIFKQSEVSFISPIILWTLVLGLMIGVLQATKFSINKEIQYYQKGKHIFYPIWGIVFLLIEMSILFIPSLVNLSVVAVTLAVSTLVGINFVLAFKLKALKREKG